MVDLAIAITLLNLSDKMFVSLVIKGLYFKLPKFNKEDMLTLARCDFLLDDRCELLLY